MASLNIRNILDLILYFNSGILYTRQGQPKDVPAVGLYVIVTTYRMSYIGYVCQCYYMQDVPAVGKYVSVTTYRMSVQWVCLSVLLHTVFVIGFWTF